METGCGYFRKKRESGFFSKSLFSFFFRARKCLRFLNFGISSRKAWNEKRGNLYLLQFLRCFYKCLKVVEKIRLEMKLRDNSCAGH